MSSTFTLSFDPTTAGPHTAEASGLRTGTSHIPVPLSGYAASSNTQTDSFVVGPASADILFVVEVSGSPSTQATVAAALPGFLAAANGTDYRIAVTTDNDDASDATAEFGRLEPCPTCSMAGSVPIIISPTSVPDGGSAADPGTALANLYSSVPNNAYPASDPTRDHYFLALYNALQRGRHPASTSSAPARSSRPSPTARATKDDDSACRPAGSMTRHGLRASSASTSRTPISSPGTSSVRPRP